MQPLVKAGLAGAVIATTGGGAYGIYDTFLKPTETSNKSEPITPATKKYSEIFGDTLLSTEDNDNSRSNWEARLTSLKKVNSDTELVADLAAIKKDSEGDVWKKLRKWCENKKATDSKGEGNNEFKNIQNYCTFSVKEKITKAIETNIGDEDPKWQKGHEALKRITNESRLDETLRQARSKTDKEAKLAIKKWCTEAYEKPYKGKDDNDFKNASEICLDNG